MKVTVSAPRVMTSDFAEKARNSNSSFFLYSPASLSSSVAKAGSIVKTIGRARSRA